jgi:uncharacterized membrane protein YadS
MMKNLIISLLVAALITYFYHMMNKNDQSDKDQKDENNMLYPIFITSFICAIVLVSVLLDNSTDSELQHVLRHTSDGTAPF